MKYSGAIGVFDGVHRGHLSVLRRVLQNAARRRATAAVITFDRHPLRTLAPHLAPRCLQTLAQRLATLSQMGFKRVFVLPFTAALANLNPRQFVAKFLVRRFNLSELVVGYDFHFGRGGKGDARMLARLGKAAGIDVEIIGPVLDQKEPVSSTRIRKLVSLGKLSEASRLLGRPYALIGRRVPGARRGRKLGFPTINIKPENELLPPLGVYAVRFGPKQVPGVANFGTKPTFSGKRARALLEVHLLSRGGASLAGPLEASLIRFLRPERRFPTVESLQRQVGFDKKRARRLLRRGRR